MKPMESNPDGMEPGDVIDMVESGTMDQMLLNPEIDRLKKNIQDSNVAPKEKLQSLIDLADIYARTHALDEALATYHDAADLALTLQEYETQKDIVITLEKLHEKNPLPNTQQ